MKFPEMRSVVMEPIESVEAAKPEPILDPAVIPLKIELEGSAEKDDELMTTLEELGIKNIPYYRRKMFKFLQKEEILIYNWDKVDEFLKKEAAKHNTHKRTCYYRWSILSDEDFERFYSVEKGLLLSTLDSSYQHDLVSTNIYNKQVPLHALKIMKTIKSEFPESIFMVSDYETLQNMPPDPFLAVMAPVKSFNQIIVDHWDEPNWGF